MDKIETVKLYKIKIKTPDGGTVISFSLSPLNKEQLLSGYEGSDDGGKEYRLPEGLYVKKDWQGRVYIGERTFENGVERWNELPIQTYEDKYPVIEVYNIDPTHRAVNRKYRIFKEIEGRIL